MIGWNDYWSNMAWFYIYYAVFYIASPYRRYTVLLPGKFSYSSYIFYCKLYDRNKNYGSLVESACCVIYPFP